MSSAVYVFLGYVPILPTNSIPNPILVSFSVTPLLNAFLYFDPTLKKNLCVGMSSLWKMYSRSCLTLPLHSPLHHFPSATICLRRSPHPPPPPPPNLYRRAGPNCSLHHQHPTHPPVELLLLPELSRIPSGFRRCRKNMMLSSETIPRL